MASECWHLKWYCALRWCHNGRDRISNHQPHHCLLNRLFRRRSKKTLKLRVTGICVGSSPGPVNSPHKWPVTWNMFPFEDVIMDVVYAIDIYEWKRELNHFMLISIACVLLYISVSWMWIWGHNGMVNLFKWYYASPWYSSHVLLVCMHVSQMYDGILTNHVDGTLIFHTVNWNRSNLYCFLAWLVMYLMSQKPEKERNPWLNYWIRLYFLWVFFINTT